MRLCFGTFARVLQLCKLDGVTDPRLVGTMTRTIDPNCQYIKSENATSVHRLLNCTGNLSPGNITDGGIGIMRRPGSSISSVLILAPRADRTDLTQKFADDVIGLLDENKKLNAVLALLNIIERDEVINDDSASGKKRSFEKYVATTKNALLSQSDYVLSDLLAGIFLYTVAAGVLNTVGKECVKLITSEFISSLSNTRCIKFVDYFPSQAQEKSRLLTFTESVPTFDDEIFHPYLTKARDKYSTIKTLLYNDQPKPFYEFYVCNSITLRPQINDRRSMRQHMITDANIKKLSEISHYLFITGTGGLGKSMMMRHLMLNAIDNYNEFGFIPIFIPLKEFDETSGNLLSYVLQKISDFKCDITQLMLEDALSAGRCLLLFDGLDEIAMSSIDRFEHEINSFTDEYPLNQFVISSRPFQAFVSYQKFSILRILPFDLRQALQLIDNLDFCPDDPSIKEKFRKELSTKLYRSHRAFTENPLLLTIMLMTFEMYAEVPSQMYLFYREAFNVLSRNHDASKGYNRELKTKLSVDAFGDIFSEICFRTYRDGKFEFSKPEFDIYFNMLQNPSVKNITATDFLQDTCYSMCLMYQESGRFYFIHRSFQEYFCAVFLSRQKDAVIGKLGNFFENRERRMRGDQTFSMLNDLIPDKIDEFVFIPFLENLFERCDNEKGYWTFLEEMYPIIEYTSGEAPMIPMMMYRLPRSFLLSFLLEHFKLPDRGMYYDLENLPEYSEFVQEEFVFVRIGEDDDEVDLIPIHRLRSRSDKNDDTQEIVGRSYAVEVSHVLANGEDYQDFIEMLDNDRFIYKIQYNLAREYLKRLKAKCKSADASLLDIL